MQAKFCLHFYFIYSKINEKRLFTQTPEFGGGEIYFDDVLVRKDGFFVLDELKDLNWGMEN